MCSSNHPLSNSKEGSHDILSAHRKSNELPVNTGVYNLVQQGSHTNILHWQQEESLELTRLPGEQVPMMYWANY